MADPGERKIPDGWTFVDKVKDKSTRPHYLCPATGQHFYTYEDMMRYVTYAKFEQLSIYAPDFDPKGKGQPQKKETRKRSSNSAKKQKGPRGSKKRARLRYAKPTYSADQEDENGEKSSDSSSDSEDPPYVPKNEPGSTRRIGSKLSSDSGFEPADLPYSAGVGPGSNDKQFSKVLSLYSSSESDGPPEIEPSCNEKMFSKVLTLDTTSESEDLPHLPGIEPGSDSDSDSAFPPFMLRAEPGSKSRRFANLSSDSASDPDDPTYFPEIKPRSNKRKVCKLRLGSRSAPKDPPYLPGSSSSRGRLEGRSDSGCNPDEPPYLPGNESGSSSKALAEPEPPKIILYQRKSKLKDQANKNLGKTAKP